jgi:hypothetical protein
MFKLAAYSTALLVAFISGARPAELLRETDFSCPCTFWAITGSARYEPAYPVGEGVGKVVVVNSQGDQGTLTQTFITPDNGGGQYTFRMRYKIDGALGTVAFVVSVAGNPVLYEKAAQPGDWQEFSAKLEVRTDGLGKARPATVVFAADGGIGGSPSFVVDRASLFR